MNDLYLRLVRSRLMVVMALASLSCGQGSLPFAAGDGGAVDRHPDLATRCPLGVFPDFNRFCLQTSDCRVGLHQTDCCGSQRALGLSTADKPLFDAAEVTCRSQWPACGCPSRGIVADDGKTVTAQDGVGFRCDHNQCTTYGR